MCAARCDATKTSVVLPRTRHFTTTPPLLGVMPIRPVASLAVDTSSTESFSPALTNSMIPICHMSWEARRTYPAPTCALMISIAGEVVVSAGDCRSLELFSTVAGTVEDGEVAFEPIKLSSIAFKSSELDSGASASSASSSSSTGDAAEEEEEEGSASAPCPCDFFSLYVHSCRPTTMTS